MPLQGKISRPKAKTIDVIARGMLHANKKTLTNAENSDG